MKKTFNLTKNLPEPFNTALQLDDFTLDYHLIPNQDDHKWLKEHGYIINIGNDCGMYVSGLSGLNATSYGNWGSVYYDSKSCIYDKGFEVFCEMYNDDIIIPWRIRFYYNHDMYSYDHDMKQWNINGNINTYDCIETPLLEIIKK